MLSLKDVNKQEQHTPTFRTQLFPPLHITM